MPNIDDHIRKAMEEGKFDNLSGKGQPIRWDENPFVEQDWQLAFRMLRDSGFALPWMETRKEIEKQLEAARSVLQRTWSWKQEAIADGQAEAFVVDQWQRAVITFREQITEINKHIVDYNLEVPLVRFQRRPVDAEAEIQLITREGEASGT